MKNRTDLKTPRPEPQRGLELKKIGLVLSVVSELTACIVGGVAIGYFFWSKGKISAGWATLISLAGVGLGFYRLIRFAQNQAE